MDDHSVPSKRVISLLILIGLMSCDQLEPSSAPAAPSLEAKERCARSGREWFEWKRRVVDTENYYLSKQVQFAHDASRETCLCYYAMASDGMKTERGVVDVLRNESLLLWTESLKRGVDVEKNEVITTRERFDARVVSMGFVP